MQFLNNENKILAVIKFGPIIFVIMISLLFTNVFINHQQEKLSQQIKNLENEFIEINKKRAKEEVERVYINLTDSLSDLEKELKNNIESRVNEAYTIAYKIYIEGKNKGLNKKEIFNEIKNTLSKIVFNEGRGYYFIIDKDANLLLQPLYSNLEGKNLLSLNNQEIEKFANNVITAIKNKKDRVDSYSWHKSNDKSNINRKFSYYKYFEPFDIVIGTGEHIDEYEKILQKKLLEDVNKIRFGSDGYIFIFDSKGVHLAHYNKKFLNKSLWDFKDSNGNFTVRDITNYALDEREGFFKYTVAFKPNNSDFNREKISYIRYFEDWDWVIGTGFYLDELLSMIDNQKEKLIEENKAIVDDIINNSIFSVVIFVIISFLVSKLLENRFNTYKKNLEIQMNKALNNEKMLVQQSKMATMGEMIGNIAHQMKQPLNMIRMTSSSLKFYHETDTMTDEHIVDTTKRIEESVLYLSDTIDDFKRFFDPNKLKKYFYIKKAVDKALRLISSQFKNNDIEVVTHIEDIEINNYENELLQVLINIINNAKDELIKKENQYKKYIFINAHKVEDKLIIKIYDNADGIPDDIIDKIYDSHFTTKGNNGGTGIGLYMSRYIVENSLFGTINVKNIEFIYEDETYRGAEFTIELPLS